MAAPAEGSTDPSFVQTFVITINENTGIDDTWIAWASGTFGNGIYVKDLLIEQINDTLR